jgi:CubicO group peptidase (beta-lactamase class C family)
MNGTKFARGVAAGLLAGGVLAMSGAGIAPPARAQGQAPEKVVLGTLKFSAEDEAVYEKRFNMQRQSAGARGMDEWYDPQEPIVGVANFKPFPKAGEGQRTIGAEALKAVNDYAAAMNSDALIVWRNGKIESESYPNGGGPDKPIVSRSLAKPVTAAAVGRAIALGKIKSLDQPVADFVTEWKGDARKEKILVRHLLDFRSGFLPQAMAREPMDILNRAYLHPRHEEIIVKEYPVVDEPGTRYEYNNATSELVAVLIERATGRRYAEFVGTEIFQKIGARGGTVWVNRPGGTAHSGCCMLVPAETFLRLAVLYLQDGTWEGTRLLPEGYVKQMRTGTPQNPWYGMGVYVAGPYTDRRGAANPERRVGQTLHSEPYLDKDLFLFDGNGNQTVFVSPAQNLVVLRTGYPPPRGEGKPEFDNAYLPNTVLRGIVKDKQPMTAQAR